MRKWNALVSAAILLLCLLHGILGGFQLLGGSSSALKAIAWTAVGLILVHTGMGLKLTADTLRALRRTGAGYFRENRLFWLRRVSGVAIMLFLALHLLAFRATGTGGGYRLPIFGTGDLISQLLLVLSIGVHVISNIRPMMTALGAKNRGHWAVDLLLVLAVLLLFFGAAFVIYYLRWNVW